jgi:hypothetical protein
VTVYVNDLLQDTVTQHKKQNKTQNNFNRMVLKWTEAADAALAVAFLRVLQLEAIQPSQHKATILDTLKEFGIVENWESVRSVTVPIFLQFSVFQLRRLVPSCFRKTLSIIIHPLVPAQQQAPVLHNFLHHAQSHC